MPTKDRRRAAKIPKVITADQLLAEARRLQGAKLASIGGRATFTVHVEGDSLVFTPTSTKRPRRQPRQKIEELLDIYNKTGSYATTTYHDVTYNSVYFLGLIRHIQTHRPLENLER